MVGKTEKHAAKDEQVAARTALKKHKAADHSKGR
jgi:hypothetical protein